MRRHNKIELLRAIILIFIALIMILFLSIESPSDRLTVYPGARFNFSTLIHRVEHVKGLAGQFPEEEDILQENDVLWGNLNLEQNDSKLLNYIRRYHLLPPPFIQREFMYAAKGVDVKEGGQTTFRTMVDWRPWIKTPNRYVQQTLARYVHKLLRRKLKGTFIECGAGDGDYFSNTRLFEEKLGWTGLLIEPDTRPLEVLLGRRRNAWISNACASPIKSPKKEKFQRHNTAEGWTRMVGNEFYAFEENYELITAQCFPIYSIAMAANISTVDYLSLDIEGSELDVLRTIPWDKMFIRVMSAEVFPHMYKPVKEYMTNEVGYKYVAFIKNDYSHDQIYAHPSL